MKSPKTVMYSSIALLCIIAMFAVNWLFIIPAAILSFFGWKALMN